MDRTKDQQFSLFSLPPTPTPTPLKNRTLTAARFVAQVGKPPHIAQSNTVADTRQDELSWRRPLDALTVFLVRVGRLRVLLTAIASALRLGLLLFAQITQYSHYECI